jgi:hypothetical protein
MKSYYIVKYADWDIDDHIILDGRQVTIPSSTEIDIRTMRSASFGSKKEALSFAQRYKRNYCDDEWLAYLEILKCETKIIKKLK